MNDNNIDPYLKAINQTYPRLKIQASHLHDPDEGQYNNVLTVETPAGPLIFRFPRNEIGVTTLEKELRLLGRLQNQTTLPIPNPTYTSRTNHTPGQVFMGYPKLPGQPLQREHFKNAPNKTILNKWASQMVKFLVELHQIPLDHFDDLPVNETLAEFQELYADISLHLFPHMRPTAQKQTAAHFENYFNNPALHNFPIALRHGDFGTGNILYDPDTLDLTGVIDFSFAGPGDPAIDIAALSTLNETFFGFVQEAYPNIEPLLARSCFYKGTFLLYEALYGLKTGSQEIFQEAIAPYI
jgi:aminoglycoside 2''-phosphotransferase